MRAAIYATPAPGSPLATLAAAWLGRDAFTDEVTRGPDPSLDPHVAEPARYGFHATLRAPFRPRDGVTVAELAERLAGFCAMRRRPVIRRLALKQLDVFLALVPDEPEPSLSALEAELLDAFEPLRAPLLPAEIARRRPERLSERQRTLLDRWGYPFVLDEFRFHMTLTGRVPDAGTRQALQLRLETQFRSMLGRPLAVDGLALFIEPAPDKPFYIKSFFPFDPRTAVGDMPAR